MARRSTVEASVTAVLDRGSAVPLHRQLYEGLRGAILAGRLAAGTRLPSTRSLASELGVSRNTVAGAFLELSAEGYLEGRRGSGTHVSRSLPEEPLRERPAGGFEASPGRKGLRLSEWGTALADTPTTVFNPGGDARPFRPGVPELAGFPFRTWWRISGRLWRSPPPELLGYGDPAGYGPLREEIAKYLGAARAVRCSWEQVIVVSGSQQALDLCARLLLDPGDEAWVEDPCYGGARAVLAGAGANLVGVPVDEEGLDVGAGEKKAPGARLVYATPSHQYPLGVTMSLSRRLRLLGWASRAGAWILEDDYDGEFRYSGKPLEALQGLDAEGRVVYLGSFSKVLFPSLRLGYLVVPPGLVDAFARARMLADRHSPSVEQAVLAEFIAEGHFGRHVRRMRKLYAGRQGVLVEAASRELSGLLEVEPSGTGMHAVGWLPAGTNEEAASRRAAAKGVEVPPLAPHRIETGVRPGLLLGFGAFDARKIEAGVRNLAEALS